jgi:DNA repair protein RadC
MGSSPMAVVRPESTRCKECGAVVYRSDSSPAPRSPGDRRELVTCSADVARICSAITRWKREVFLVLALDTRKRLLGKRRIAIGTLDQCLVHPREVFKPLIAMSAASTILVHNHPSGDPGPSELDRSLTQRLREAGELLQLPVIDHVVVGKGGHYSFLASGEFR